MDKQHVVILDDNGLFLLMLEQHFKTQPVWLSVTNDPYECLSFLEPNNSNLLFVLDINLPELSGLQVAKMIRAKEQQSGLRPSHIVVTSSEHVNPTRIDEKIEKFVAKEALVSHINRFLATKIE
ncbi:hypothetical protein PALB_18760 [Pseudoalteromonas luteoviolacea B = ATCC 29581]|nr:hypothetical protein PALB_18760 [Pseudoalteromonas luteoviolacea B = ATCC 29581]